MAAAALLILAASVLLSASPGAADPAQDTEEQAFLSLLNNYRTSQGAGALVLQDDLNEAADWYVTDMATKNYYGSGAYCAQFNETAHCDSLGRMPPARVKAFGYPQSVGENSAAGFSTAQQVFDAWKASGPHNQNMLRADYRAIGIGRACNPHSNFGCYWVTDFGFYTGPGSPNPSQTAPPPTQPPTPASTPVKTPTVTPTPNTPAPTPTVPTLFWDDINCDGHVTPDDAVRLLRGDVGFDAAGGGSSGCPAVGDLVLVRSVVRIWGDTDCSHGVQALDSIKLLAFLAAVPFDDVNGSCPAPGTSF